jgi:hypothetical protein
MLGGALMWSGAARPATPPAQPGTRCWRFDVLLNGKRIGEHVFRVTDHGQSADVDTRAHFRVRALFVPLYGYDHHDHEVWRDGCLATIDTETSDNGRQLAVHGHLTGDTFEVRGPQGAESLPACVKSFAYWDLPALGDHRLLNAQTGDYESVELSHHGTETIPAQGRRVQAEHYSLTAKSFTIDLWYSLAGDWLALESHPGPARTLRYEIP